jgi:DHA2 family multidrug resistance protein
MMPIIGNLIQKGVPQTYMVALGFLVFFGFTFWMYSVMTPDTGAEHFFWPLILRGVGLGLLFVPITTMALSTLKGKHIGEGAAFTGMMRQLGGSFGIAIITTFITRFTQSHRADLVANLDVTKPFVQTRVQQLKMAFEAKGFSSNEAYGKALQLLDGSVMKQATVMSYMDIFLYLGILFLCCIPIILLVKRGKNKIDPAEAMH